MTILDSFYLLFESDASKLDKGLDDSRRKGRELTQDLKQADAAAEGLGRSLGSTIRQLAGVALGVFSVQALAQAFTGAVQEADALGESADRLGVAVETLGAWGDAAKLAGGSTQGVIQSVERLNEGLAALDVVGKSRVTPFLKELGINMEDAANKGKTAFDLFPQIAEAMEGMSRTQAVAIGTKLGLDQGTIMLLMQGRREVELAIARQKELGTITRQQADTAAKFNDQLDNTRQAWRSVWLEIAQAVLPAFTAVVKGFEYVATFMRRHSDFIIGGLLAIGGVLAAVLLPALIRTGIAAVVAMAPFLLTAAAVGAAILAIALLWDEVQNWVDGADSLIGRHLGTWEEFLDLIDAIAPAVIHAFSSPQALLESIVELIKRMGIGLLEAAGFMEPLERAWDTVTGKVRAFVDLVRSALSLAKGIGGALLGLVTGKTPAVAGMPEARGALAAAAGAPLASVSSSAVSNMRGGDRSTRVDVGGVTIQTPATDADGISRAVGTSLGAQLSQAAANYDDGVLA